MNSLIVLVGSLGILWLLAGFIGTRLFWYWWHRGKVGFGTDPIPVIATILGIIWGPFMLIYVICDRAGYSKRMEKRKIEDEKNAEIFQRDTARKIK